MRGREPPNRVTFSRCVRVFVYDPEPATAESFGGRRTEPNIVDRGAFAGDVRNLFREAMEKDVFVVYGNLGRHPYLLEYYLDVCLESTRTVRIRSSWWNEIRMDGSFRDDASACDLLILVEPSAHEVVHPVAYAKSILVLTSLRRYPPCYPSKSLYLGENQNILNILNRYTREPKSGNYRMHPQIFCNDRIPFFEEATVEMKLSKPKSTDENRLCILNLIDSISNLKIENWTVDFE